MIRLLTMVLLLSLSTFGWASAYPDKYEGVPNTFKDGDIIKAVDFNNNNESIKKAINDIPTGPKGDKGDKGDTGEQGIQGIQGEQGPAGNNGVQGVKGDTGNPGVQGIQGQQGPAGVGFPGVVATLRSSSLPDQDGSAASNVFDAVTNIASNSSCTSNGCDLYVQGVSDHRRCVTQIEGVGTWAVNTNYARIAITNSQTTGNWVAIVIHCIN